MKKNYEPPAARTPSETQAFVVGEPDGAPLSAPVSSVSRTHVRKNGKLKPKRRWLPYLGALLLVALIVGGLWPKPVPVETATVSRGPLRITVNEEGKTRIKQRYLVSAPVAGLLQRIPFKAGAEVVAGETIVAVIDPLPPAMLDARSRSLAEARRDTAAANVERARAAHDYALAERRRAEKLAANLTIAVQELETAQWRETSAAKELAAAESALREAEAELAEFTVPSQGGDTRRPPAEVKAPVTGRILRVIEESSRVVTPGTPLAEIGDPGDLEVVVEVLSRDGAAIAPGTKVEFDQWGGGPPLQGVVRLVEPAAFTKVSALGVEEQRVNVIADLTTPVEQRRGLGDNFRVEARIIVAENPQALKVPSGALFRRGQQWAAFVLNNGRAELRPVEAGQSNGIETEVLSGLQEGDEVIVYPGDRIQPDQRVIPTKV